jgi:hypothetical protein
MSSQYRITYVFRDAYGRKTRKLLETEVISDVDLPTEFNTAAGYAAAMATALANLSEAELLWYTIAYEVVYADTVDAGANVDEGVTFVCEKGDGKNGVIKVAAPINAIFNVDGSVDLTDGVVTAFLNQFLVGGGFTFSDGENVTQILSGRLDK